MLNRLQTVLRYGYNYGDNLIRYTSKYPPRLQPASLKEKHSVGDQPEYLYNTHRQFEEEYKPYIHSYSNIFLVGTVALSIYFTIRYEVIRSKEGKGEVHRYPI